MVNDVDVGDVRLMIGEHLRQPEEHAGLIGDGRQNGEVGHGDECTTDGSALAMGRSGSTVLSQLPSLMIRQDSMSNVTSPSVILV